MASVRNLFPSDSTGRLHGQERKKGRKLPPVWMGARCGHANNIRRGLWGGEGIIPLEGLTTGTVVSDMRALQKIVPVRTCLLAGRAVHDHRSSIEVSLHS